MNIRIAEVIRKKRDESGLTQEQLANALGVTKAAVSKWELEQSLPDTALLPEIADFFQISLDELFGKEPSGSAENRIAFPVREDTLTIFAAYGSEIVKGEEFTESMKNLTIELPFDVVNVDSQFSVRCGDVKGSVSAGGSIVCDDVGGDVSAGDSVECDEVEGDVSAGTSVACDEVDGDVSAGTSVICDDVEGDVSAGASVSCGNVEGDISAGGSVSCGNVEGDVSAGGSVECGNVEGDVSAGDTVSCGDIGGDVYARDTESDR